MGLLYTILLLVTAAKCSKVPSHITVSTIEPPLLPIPIFSPTYNGLMSREALRFISSALKFKYTVTYPKDLRFGSNLNGTWDGMVGQLLTGKADFSVQLANVNLARYQVVDGSYPILFDTTSILIPFPKENDRVTAVMEPFSVEVWVCIFISVLLTTACLTVKHLNDTSAHRYPFGAQLMNVVSIITGQGIDSSEKRPAARYVLTGWSLTAVVVTNVYISVLTSMLAIPSYRPVVNSIEELGESNILPTTPRGTALEILFLSAKEGAYKKVGDRMRTDLKRALPPSSKDGLEDVAAGIAAHLAPALYIGSIMAEDFQEKRVCRFLLAKRTFNPMTFGFMFPKKSNLTAVFNLQILRMHEYGFLVYAHRRIAERNDRCQINKKSSKYPVLKLFHFSGAFIILALGYVLAFVVFLYERISKRIRQNYCTPR